MFESSLLRALNIYLVENLSHTVLSIALVAVVIVFFRIRHPATRIRFLLLPVVIPIVSSPIYYLLFPERYEFALLNVDKWVNIEDLLNRPGQWPALPGVLTAIILIVIGFLFFRSVLSLLAVLALPRYYSRLAELENPQFYTILNLVSGKVRMKPPAVLLSPDTGIVCCAFGFKRPYILISRGALEQLSPAELESVLAHEVGHVCRRDGWLALALVTFRNVLFFNPVIHFLYHRILRDAELAADDIAINLGSNRLAYAASLVKVGYSWLRESTGRSDITRCFLCRHISIKTRVLHALTEPLTARTTRDKLVLYATGVSLSVGLFFVC